jgi:hypothetical protein
MPKKGTKSSKETKAKATKKKVAKKPVITPQMFEEYFFKLSHSKFIQLTKDWNEEKLKIKLTKQNNYDEWLNYFKSMSPNQIKLLAQTGLDILPTEGYAALSRWHDIITNPSRIDKIHKAGLTGSGDSKETITTLAAKNDRYGVLKAIRDQLASKLQNNPGNRDTADISKQLTEVMTQIADYERRLAPDKKTVLGELLADMPGTEIKSKRPAKNGGGARQGSFKSRVTIRDVEGFIVPKKYGNQKPRIDQFNDGDIWLADKTIILLAEYGIELLPWQKAIVYRWMAVYQDEDGKWLWSNPKAGLLVPRQNGKTEIIIARVIGGMIFMGEALIYTAHSDKTVDEVKRRVQNFFYAANEEIRDLLMPEFDKEPKSLDYIELRTKGRCVFRTRTRTGGLGTTNDTLILDEAQEETDAQQEALLPTISAGKSQNQQIIRAGTPPSGGGNGTVFIRIRQNVIDGKDHDTCWQEWSVELLTDPQDEEAWYYTNPSLGYHLILAAVKNEAKDMAIDSFNKMRLGWIAGIESKRAIPDAWWSRLKVDKVEIAEDVTYVYAIKFAPDGSAVSLSIGLNMPDGKVHVEMIERKPMSAGTSWLIQFLTDSKNRWRKCSKIIIDGASGTQLLVEELVRIDRRLSKKILTPNVKEAGAAYAGFHEAVEHSKITHFDQPALNMSIKTVKKRNIGKDGMFGYASMNTDIQSDPTESVAFAYYGAVRFKKVKPSNGSGQSIMV